MVPLVASVTYVQASPSIWDLVLPFVGAVCAIALAGAACYPFYRKHKDLSDARNERIDSACDAVLGREANPNKGRSAFGPGMIHLLPLGDNRLAGVPTVMDGVSEARSAADRAAVLAAAAEAGQRDLERHVTDALTQHAQLDESRFSDLGEQLAQLARRPQP